MSLKIILKILKNQRNDTNFRYMFVKGFYITLKNYPSYYTNSFTVVPVIFFFQKRYFQNVK